MLWPYFRPFSARKNRAWRICSQMPLGARFQEALKKPSRHRGGTSEFQSVLLTAHAPFSEPLQHRRPQHGSGMHMSHKPKHSHTPRRLGDDGSLSPTRGVVTARVCLYEREGHLCICKPSVNFRDHMNMSSFCGGGLFFSCIVSQSVLPFPYFLSEQLSSSESPQTSVTFVKTLAITLAYGL